MDRVLVTGAGGFIGWRARAPQGVRGRNSDNSLMRKTLDWEPTISLEKGLEIIYEWIERQVNEMQ